MTNGLIIDVFNKEWANGQLRAALELLKEGYLSENFWLWNQRLAAAIMIKTELTGRLYPWQAARIENMIHRYQGKINEIKADRPALTRNNGSEITSNLQANRPDSAEEQKSRETSHRSSKNVAEFLKGYYEGVQGHV